MNPHDNHHPIEIDGPYSLAWQAELRHLARVAGWAMAMFAALGFMAGLIVGVMP